VPTAARPGDRNSLLGWFSLLSSHGNPPPPFADAMSAPSVCSSRRPVGNAHAADAALEGREPVVGMLRRSERLTHERRARPGGGVVLRDTTHDRRSHGPAARLSGLTGYNPFAPATARATPHKVCGVGVQSASNETTEAGLYARILRGATGLELATSGVTGRASGTTSLYGAASFSALTSLRRGAVRLGLSTATSGGHRGRSAHHRRSARGRFRPGFGRLRCRVGRARRRTRESTAAVQPDGEGLLRVRI
jgi:hypothetical protein